jgi:hypothetical protein
MSAHNATYCRIKSRLFKSFKNVASVTEEFCLIKIRLQNTYPYRTWSLQQRLGISGLIQSTLHTKSLVLGFFLSLQIYQRINSRILDKFGTYNLKKKKTHTTTENQIFDRLIAQYSKMTPQNYNI